MDQPNSENVELQEAEMRAELARISQKLYSIEDPDVRSALKARVAELQLKLGIDTSRLAAEISVPQKQEAPKTGMAELQAVLEMQKAKIRQQSVAEEEMAEILVDGEIPTPTASDLEAADKLVQQARVEKMRNNAVKVRELLEEAARVAPGSSPVQEMLGDEYAERKQSAKALAAYRRAVKIDPKNVNAERKLAQVALSIDTGASMVTDDSAIPMASQKAALFISIFFPGLGHIVVGQKTKGSTILGLWLASTAWLILQWGDLAKLLAMAGGGRVHPNLLVLVPVMLMLILFVVTLADFKKPQEDARKPIDRPRPPVDLPFE